MSKRVMLLLAVALAAATAESQTTTYVAAPDGTGLATDVYLPPGDGPWPVVLERTPYGKDDVGAECWAFTSLGYACVAQDTRGRFASEGTDTVFRHDAVDGRATVEWIAAQPWCNGAIGTYGGSAVGMTQYALALSADPELRCMLPAFATPDLYHHAFLYGGAIRTEMVENWLTDQGSFDLIEELKRNRLHGPWWAPIDMLRPPGEVRAAGLHAAGWYDVFSQGNIDAFTNLQSHGGDGALGRQYLFVGPWTHQGHAGELVYPDVDPAAMLFSLVGPWFDHCLKGETNEVAGWPPVNVYLMGAVGEPGAPGNQWIGLQSWPPLSRTARLHLDDRGELLNHKPEVGETTLFIDPDDPVPTLGGANLFPWVEVDGRQMGSGSYDQRPIEARDEVLVFTSEVLDRPLTVMGRVRCVLWIRPDTLDLDLAVRLTDVYPDGRSMLVLDGIQRARMRCGDEEECLLTPGQPTEIVVDLWSTALVFNAGHRIGVSVSGTNSPRFEVNPNHGGDLDGAASSVVARPDLLFGPDHPSRLELPVPVLPRQVSGRVVP